MTIIMRCLERADLGTYHAANNKESVIAMYEWMQEDMKH